MPNVKLRSSVHIDHVYFDVKCKMMLNINANKLSGAGGVGPKNAGNLDIWASLWQKRCHLMNKLKRDKTMMNQKVDTLHHSRYSK